VKEKEIENRDERRDDRPITLGFTVYKTHRKERMNERPLIRKTDLQNEMKCSEQVN
jgi:hypothetical protein